MDSTKDVKPIRVTFAWNELNGYMTACWMQLQKYSHVAVSVVAFQSRRGYANDLGDGLDNAYIVDRNNYVSLANVVRQTEPDIVVVCGWGNPGMRKLARDSSIRAVRILVLDAQWQGTVRQRIGTMLLRRHIANFSAVVVASDRGREYARQLGFASDDVMTGMYAVDTQSFAEAGLSRRGWPKRFAFVGRFAEEEGVSELVEAYSAYREAVEDPWPFDCFGAGPLESAIKKCEGMFLRGFVQPADLPTQLAEAGVFVLPSSYEPWGAVIAEAMASGLPILCTHPCGAGVDLVQHCYNGYKASPNADSILSGLLWLHDNYESLAVMGARSSTLVEACSPSAWCERWIELFNRQLSKELI